MHVGRRATLDCPLPALLIPPPPPPALSSLLLAQLLLTELQCLLDAAPRSSKTSIHDRMEPFTNESGIIKTLDLPPPILRCVPLVPHTGFRVLGLHV